MKALWLFKKVDLLSKLLSPSGRWLSVWKRPSRDIPEVRQQLTAKQEMQPGLSDLLQWEKVYQSSVYVSHSAYLFWPLRCLCTLKIIEKMKHVLCDVFFLENLCWKLNGILAVTVSRILHWWQWVLGQCLSDSDFHGYILHKFYQNGTHQLTQGGHRLFLFQGTKTKVWEEVLLQNSVQSLGNQTWYKICNKGIMMVAGTKFPPNVMHMTGRTWMKTGRGCRVPSVLLEWWQPDLPHAWNIFILSIVG